MIVTGRFTGRTGPIGFFNRPDRTGLPFSNRFQLWVHYITDHESEQEFKPPQNWTNKDPIHYDLMIRWCDKENQIQYRNDSIPNGLEVILTGRKVRISPPYFDQMACFFTVNRHSAHKWCSQRKHCLEVSLFTSNISQKSLLFMTTNFRIHNVTRHISLIETSSVMLIVRSIAFYLQSIKKHTLFCNLWKYLLYIHVKSNTERVMFSLCTSFTSTVVEKLSKIFELFSLVKSLFDSLCI